MGAKLNEKSPKNPTICGHWRLAKCHNFHLYYRLFDGCAGSRARSSRQVLNHKTPKKQRHCNRAGWKCSAGDCGDAEYRFCVRRQRWFTHYFEDKSQD